MCINTHLKRQFREEIRIPEEKEKHKQCKITEIERQEVRFERWKVKMTKKFASSPALCPRARTGSLSLKNKQVMQLEDNLHGKSGI